MTSSTRELTERVGTSGREVVLVGEPPEWDRERPGTVVDRALQQPTAREVASAYLHGAVRMSGRIDEVVISIADRLQRAHEEGDLPAHADPGLLARYLVTVSSGLAVQAGGGAGRAELHRVADVALRALPSA